MPKLTEAHFEARRKEILDATFRCLARKGYARMTLRDIAAEAGISVGTLYLYFENKDQMVRALSEEARVEADAMLAEELEEGSPTEILAAILRSLMGDLERPEREQTLRVDVQLWAEALQHASLNDLFQSSLESRVEQLSPLIAEVQKEGRLPAAAEPEGLARIFLSILLGLELQKALNPDLSVDRLVESLQALLEIEQG